MIICRVCFDNSEKLIPLLSDKVEAIPIVHMLKEFTIIHVEQQLPKYICETCAEQLDVAYAFKRKYEDAIVAYIRHMSDQTDQTDEDGAMTSYQENTSTEDVADCKQEETIHHTEMNGVTIDGELTVEESKVEVSPLDLPQSISLNNLTLSDDVEPLSSDQTFSETQCEIVEHSSAYNQINMSYRPLTLDVLSRIYKYHYNRGKKPFKCDVCCRWFKTKGHIKAHRMRHTERDNRIKCNKCLLMFLTKPHFEKHRCFAKLQFK